MSSNPLRAVVLSALVLGVCGLVAVLVLTSLAVRVVGQGAAVDHQTRVTHQDLSGGRQLVRVTPDLSAVRPCATVWPPTCSDSEVRPVQPCATVWPPTCSHTDRRRGQRADRRNGGER